MTGLRNTPTFSISASTTSPGFRYREAGSSHGVYMVADGGYNMIGV
jgi:hypothetical protein